MKLACQILILVITILGFLFAVHQDFKGAPGKEPEGYLGFIISLFVSTFVAFVLWQAGAFSEIFK
jgi:hypothetical protein